MAGQTPVIESIEARNCSDEEEAAVRENRSKRYGDFMVNHAALGRIWAAQLSMYLQHPVPDLPADLVLLMLATNKVNRGCTPGGRGHMDSYADARIFTKMAAEAAGELLKNDTDP
jgi:hypothetical protein